MNTTTHLPDRLIALVGATALILGGIAAEPTSTTAMPMAAGPFQPTPDSLKQYRVPDWFRDAKFGIWAHWGPQAVPMMGDWYARHMYVPGHPQYQHHLATYGHPSTNGYKDIIPLWKAEKFDPDRLMTLYKQAGARYFVSMGTHHDNFFLWNSKVHRWNAAAMGPHRDIVGAWQQAARRKGLKFGVSEHLGASFTWFQDSHKADKEGPFAGVPYDGANPAFQDLYHFPAEPGDKDWYSRDPRWQRQWYTSIRELVDNYHPDLLYTDGGVPFGNEVGRSLIAHMYNQSAAGNHGRPTVVYTCKQKSEGRWIEDLERGVMAGINPDPWQTDTSIGDWYYNKNWKFRPVSWTIHMLVDIVSKNGNLLLNVVQRPDGSLDPEVEQALQELATWIRVHGEAIYGTRPWLVYGEGAIKAKGGHFKEDFAYTSHDVRFTTKGSTLYATALGWPADGRLVIRSLARPAEGAGNRITKVSLLGHRGNLPFHQTAEGLIVTLPPQQVSKYTATLRIAGRDLKPVPLVDVVEPVKADTTGALNLTAESAETHGDQLGVETRGGVSNLAFWDRASDYATWTVQVPAAGSYEVAVSVAAPSGTPELAIEGGGGRLAARMPAGRDWDDFKTVSLGRVELTQAGKVSLKAGPRDPAAWRPINLRWIKLTPVK